MQLEKFGFRIRAHNGALLDHLVIQAANADEARAKLLRMYPQCEVLSNWTESQGASNPNSKSFEDIADLLNH
ncbi:MAG: hypothetical protein IPG66_13300 [Hydrogenophilales bacterium]|nr:hypothetical protein [Hydrogenophilales bacterium]